MSRTGLAAAAPAAWPGVGPPPTPANSTLVIGRFIALHISMVSSVPEAPTSVPLMMSALLLSTNPVAATARPVNELSSEITTGMSAPPIGITIITPSTSEAPSSVRNHGAPPPSATPATSPRMPRNSRALNTLWKLEASARSEMIPCSFKKAIRLPLNEIEPITVPNTVEATAVALGRWPVIAICRNSTVETSAADTPPHPLSSATI